MRRLPLAIGSLVCLALPLATAWSFGGPDDGVPRHPCIDPAPDGSACLLAGDPLVDAPFSAAGVMSWQPPAGDRRPSRHAAFRYYRDSAGRVRAEQFFGGDVRTPERIVIAPGAPDRGAYVILPGERRASRISRAGGEALIGGGGFGRFVLPVSSAEFFVFYHLPVPSDHFQTKLDQVSLGGGMIAGVRAIGTRYRSMLPAHAMAGDRAFGMTSERWVSPELRLVVYARSEDARTGVFEYRVARLDRREPQASLFELPPEYTVTPRMSTLNFYNPYTPERGPGRESSQ